MSSSCVRKYDLVNIDLHIHTKNGSDGRWDVDDIFAEADHRSVGLISITDHDSIAAQERSIELAQAYGMRFITGVELNITFSHPDYREGKEVPLDFLGYGFDIHNAALIEKLEQLQGYRIHRAGKILEKINTELRKTGIPEFTPEDMEAIQAYADGSLARPHIARYLIRTGIVKDKREAFDKYLVKCDVPKMRFSLEEASTLIRNAGGRIVLAHPGDSNGTSLIALSPDISQHPTIIRETMMDFIDGIECWHTRHSRTATKTYVAFIKREVLIATGGSDCHQQPAILGGMQMPSWVADQFL